VFSWGAVSKILQNVSGQHADYETFKAEYDADPHLQSIVDKFDANGITIKTKEKQITPSRKTTASKSSNSLGASAKRAAAKVMKR
jgi:hypothetical protein